MSFLNIKNHEKRDEMVKEYLALKKRLRNRNEEERSDIIDHRRDLEENFEPVVASNKEMAKEIVNELTPITKELQELNNKTMQAAAAAPVPVAPRIGVKRDSSSKPKRVKQHVPNTYGPLAETFMMKYQGGQQQKGLKSQYIAVHFLNFKFFINIISLNHNLENRKSCLTPHSRTICIKFMMMMKSKPT